MYPQRVNGDQYYDTNRYKKDSNGNEIYAKLKNNCQIYLEIDGLDIMAKKKIGPRRSVLYFAVDDKGHPICPRLVNDMKYIELDISYPENHIYIELYPKLNNKEYYIGLNGKCRYARNQFRIDYYAQNNYKDYYAFKINKEQDFIEFPKIAIGGQKVYIKEGTNYIYPFNITKLKPLYPKDEHLNDCYLSLGGKECFAIRDNKPFYAKTKDGQDILPLDTDNFHYYIFSMSGNKKIEIYPIRNKKEYYIDKNNCEIYAENLDDQFYARNEKNDDYFARKSQKPYYAVNGDRVQFYPSKRNVDNTEENFYLKEGNIEVIAKKLKSGQGYYAKNSKKKEIYPKSYEVEKIKSKPKMEVKDNYNFIEPTLINIIEHEASVK